MSGDRGERAVTDPHGPGARATSIGRSTCAAGRRTFMATLGPGLQVPQHLPNAGMAEDIDHGGPLAQLRLDSGDQNRGEQGIPAKIEKIVVEPDRRDTQHLSPEPSKPGLNLCVRSRHWRFFLDGRQWEFREVYLPVLADRHLVYAN